MIYVIFVNNFRKVLIINVLILTVRNRVINLNTSEENFFCV